MTWSALAPYGVNEVAKTRWRAVPYTAGSGLDLGCGAQRLFDTEFVVGIDNGADGERGIQVAPNLRADAKALTMFAAGSWDYVFSSFLLQNFPYADVAAVLRDWLRVVKVGGCLVLYLPDADQVPKVGEPGSLPGQQWDVTYETIVNALERTGHNWDLCDYQRCSANDEYALFFAVRKLK